MRFQITAATIIILIIFGITSCKKKNNTTSMGTFYFHIHTNIDTNEVDDEILYKDASGRQLGLTTAQFYISGISIHNVNGSTYTFNDVRVIKSIDSEQYIIGQAPVGTYDNVTFTVGLDAGTNALSPTAFTATGDVPNSDMWFGNSSKGYMFMKLEGFADTTAAQTGANMVNFSYEIGSAANIKTITMPTRGTGSYTSFAPYILTANNAEYIHIIADYGKLLSGISFKTQDSTDTYNTNPALATTIANNIPGMFDYEE